jgi:hypothetical protein
MSAVDEQIAKLSLLTNMTPREWNDFLTLTPDQQKLVAHGYADMDWAKSKDTLEEVLKVLGVIGTIAGVVSGVSGAIAAVAALRSL